MTKAPTPENVTILIPTNGRPESLAASLKEIRRNISHDARVVILDSTDNSGPKHIASEYEEIYKKDENVSVIKYDHPIPPGHARKRLSEECITPYMMFLDDDHEIKAGAFEIMCGALESEGLDIVSGRWLEVGSERPIGFFHAYGRMGGDSEVIVKVPVRYDEGLKGSVLKVDEVLATMLCKKEVFDLVAFDERYEFYFELFDFFKSCSEKGIRVGVAVDAVFHHKPLKYKSVSTRQTQKRDRDEKKFCEKWNVTPVSLPVSMSSKIPLASIVRRAVSKFNIL